MPEKPIDSAQRSYARLAGVLYLFTMATSILTEVGASMIRGSGDFAEVARRVLASEHLYRAALVSTAFCALGVLVLAYALYVTLAPVNKRLAQLALLARAGEAAIIGAALAIRFGALRVYAAAPGNGSFQNDQLQVLVSLVGQAYGSGVQIWLMFFSLGSTLFFYLFYTSRYIPRTLATLGIFASVVTLFVSLGILIFPKHVDTIQFGWAPMFVAEVTTGFWLMIRGIRPAPSPDGSQGRPRLEIPRSPISG